MDKILLNQPVLSKEEQDRAIEIAEKIAAILAGHRFPICVKVISGCIGIMARQYKQNCNDHPTAKLKSDDLKKSAFAHLVLSDVMSAINHFWDAPDNV